MYTNFGQIGRQTTELPALVLMIKKYIYLVENYSEYFMNYLLSDERSLPFRLLVVWSIEISRNILRNQKNIITKEMFVLLSVPNFD